MLESAYIQLIEKILVSNLHISIIGLLVIIVSAIVLGIIVKLLGGSFLGSIVTFILVEIFGSFIAFPLFGIVFGSFISIILMIVMLNFLAGLDSWLKSFVAVFLYYIILILSVKYLFLAHIA